MSRIINKTINRAPVRSPSPDVANRNIIKRTQSPISQALSKSRLNNSLKYPIGGGFLSTEELENRIKSLEAKYNLLLKEYYLVQERNTQLQGQNDKLRSTDLTAHDQIRRHIDNGYSPGLIQEYQSRIAQMSQQIRRIHEKLGSEIKRKEEIQQQNQNIKRSQLLSGAKQTKSNVPEVSLRKNLLQIQYSLSESMDRSIAESEQKIELSLRQLQNRIKKIQNNQKYILSLLNSSQHAFTPRNIKQRTPQNSTNNRTPNSTSSFDPLSMNQRKTQQIEKQNEFLISKVGDLKQQLERYIKENRNLRKDLEQKSAMSYEVMREEYVQCSKCKFYLKMISQLENEIRELKMAKSIIAHTVESTSNTSKPSNKYLQEYLKDLQQIKHILTNEEINQYVHTLENNLNEIYNIEDKFEYMKEEKEKMLKELKEREIHQAIELADMKRENEIMKTEISQQEQQINKLKQLLNASIVGQNQRMQHPSGSKRRLPHDDSKFKRYIDQAINKIEILQNQISNTLKE